MSRSSLANVILLFLIVLLALGLRIFCYTGPIGSDDNSYYIGAYEIHEGTYQPSNNYWNTRYGMLLPIFGPHFFLFIPAMVYSLVKRERGALIFLCWAGIILFVLQFGFVSLFPPLPIIKVRKFLILATVPLILIGAWALMQLRGRFRWALAAVVPGASLYSIEPYSYKDDRTPETVGGQTERVLAYLEKLPPKSIYASRRTIGMLRISSGFEIKPERLHDLNKVTSPQDLENCYEVINRFYALFDPANPYGNLPYFVKDFPTGIPDSWKWKQFLQVVVLDVPPARPRP